MKNIFYGLILALTVNVNATTLKTDESTKELSTNSAKEFSKGDYKKSIDVLRPYWALPNEEMDNVIYQTKTAIKSVGSRFGEKLSHDFIKT